MKKTFEPLERAPLDASDFPSNLQKHVEPEAPPPMKMMAARGMVPAPPDVTLRVLYQLSLDQDRGVRGEARAALEQMPEQVLLPPIQAQQPAPVLDWVAEVRQEPALLEAVVLHKGVDDRTVATVASQASAKLCDIIATNQVRVLRSPFIIEQLYVNPNARMATVDRLIELAQRNDISFDGLPGLQDALDSGQDLGLGQDTGEDDFAELLQQEQERAAEEERELKERLEREESMTRRERENLRTKEARKEEEEEEDNRPMFVKLQDMSVGKKIRLATVGSREAVNQLVKDSNRLVHMAAIQSPRLKYNDIKKLSANKSAADGVIRYIANNRDWTRHYEIMVNLVNNPKTPMSEALRFLKHLRTNDLRQLQRNRNVPRQIARQAKNLLNKRT